MADFTDNQLEFLAVNAMGRASEAGNLPIMQLGLATNTHKDGTVYYRKDVNNSGYTVGFYQWDFGAKGKYSAHKLVDGYNNWAKNSGEPLISETNNAVQLITRHGHIYLLDGKGKRVLNQNPLEGQQSLLNQPLGKQLNKFIASGDGYQFVMSLQVKQYKDSLKTIMKKVAETPAIKNMNQDDANMVLAAYAKAVNQSGFVYHTKEHNGKKHKFLRPLPIMQEKNVDKNVIIDILKKEHTSDVAMSIEATKKGVNLYNTLSNDKTFLNSIFTKQMALDPTLANTNFKSNPECQILDAMFRNPDAAEKLIHAYNNNTAYQIDNHHGRIKDEAYTIGVTEKGVLYSVDKTGKGFCLEHNSNDWHKLNSLQDIDVAFNHHSGHQHSSHHNTPPTHAQANQPLNPLAEALRGQIEALCRAEAKKLGINWNQGMENTVYALTAAGFKNGLKQVTNLAINGDNINIADLSAGRHLYSQVNIKVAAETEIAQSIEIINKIAQANEQTKIAQQMQAQETTQQYNNQTMKV